MSNSMNANNNSTSVFPQNKYEALTMLYLQNQDLSNLTPEELFDKYQDTYTKLKSKENRKVSIKTFSGGI